MFQFIKIMNLHSNNDIIKLQKQLFIMSLNKIVLLFLY